MSFNSWFTVKVKYTKQLEDGTFKRVTEPYLLAAMTFTEAEGRIYEELGSLIRGEFVVNGIARTEVHDIFHYEDSETWWKVIIAYESEADGGEGSKAKKVRQTFLVSANNETEAAARIKESLSGMLIDFRIKTVTETNIADIFPFGEEDNRTHTDYIVPAEKWNELLAEFWTWITDRGVDTEQELVASHFLDFLSHKKEEEITAVIKKADESLHAAIMQRFETKVFKFNDTEYVQAASQKEAETYFVEEQNGGDPFEEVEEIPKDQWEVLKFKPIDENPDVGELPLSAWIEGNQRQPLLIISAEW